MAELSGPDRHYAEFVKGVWKENPVLVQVLGMCPALAVTNSATNALAMGLATLAVLVGSSTLISLLKDFIPKQVRISSYIVIIATFVTVADFTLKAMVPEIHRELGAFISLIVVNCLILGRQEAFASKNTLSMSILDALGMGLGFTLSLFMLGTVREVLGNGSFLGIDLFGASYEPWVIMILPPGGFIMLGLILLFFNWLSERRAQMAARSAKGQAA